jgi:rsbT co-antagonist protein RsbR
MDFDEADARTYVCAALRGHAGSIADRWVHLQREQAPLGSDLTETQLREEADLLVQELGSGLQGDLAADRVVTAHAGLRQAVIELSLRRARGGAAPTATALAVLALKEALLEAVQRETRDVASLYSAALLVNRVLDAAGALSFATYVTGREEIIQRQSRQLLEVSTPVVQLWDRVLAVPLVGTLDTSRTQVVMENLLGAIESGEAQVAIIDITGVPTVDTAVAHHLMQTVNAVRLMGSDCFISGIRPSIAQTIAQLGIDLSAIVTRATLSDALATAIALMATRTGRTTPPAAV